MNEPLVSVHILTYNQAEFVQETLSSTLEQDYSNLEVIVSDDGSTDGTIDIILDFANRYPQRLVPILGGPNLGITGNSNRALQRCRGKYIAFQGGDDVLLPGKIRKQVEVLEQNSSLAICYHDVDVFNSTTGKTLFLHSQRHPARNGNVKDLILFGSFMNGAASVMVRANCIPSHGYDSRIPFSSDWLFYIETASSHYPLTETIRYIPEILARYRRHSSNITLKSNEFGLEETLSALEIIRNRIPDLEPVITIAKSERMTTYGIKLLAKGKIMAATRLFNQSVCTSITGILLAFNNGLHYVYSRIVASI